jgi:DNA (cytosine-5)-methyltransferase 1
MNVSNDVVNTFRAQSHGHKPIIFGPRVRRLTPLECERLQGFPDNYTNIPSATDTDRYCAIGNSMTTFVMKWIGKRIDLVDKILQKC